MKKIGLGLLLLALWVCHASAQTKIGARFGFNLTTLTLTSEGDDKEDRKMLPGVNVGFVLDKGKFSTGLFVSMQGAKWKDDDGIYLFRTTYLNLPLHVKANIGKSKKRITGFITGGPYIALWIRLKETEKEDGRRSSSTEALGWEDYHRIDFGFSLGGGINSQYGQTGDSGRSCIFNGVHRLGEIWRRTDQRK